MDFEFCPDKKGWILNFVPTKGGNFEFCPNKKGDILNFNPVTSLKLLISPFLLGLRSQTFLGFWTLHLAYPILVWTPCTAWLLVQFPLRTCLTLLSSAFFIWPWRPMLLWGSTLKFRWSSAFAAAQQLLSDAGGWFLRCRKTDKSLNESDHHHQKGRRQDFLGEEKL